MEKKKSRFSRYSAGDKAFLITGYVLLGLFVLAIIIPMIYIVIASFMDPITLQNKGIVFELEKWTLTAYERVMSNKPTSRSGSASRTRLSIHCCLHSCPL